MASDELEFEVVLDDAGEELVVAFRGDLDLTAVERAGDALATAQAEREAVRLDLSGLRFIDSSGLRVILEAQRRAAEASRRLQIVLGGDGVRRVFTLSGVAGLLEVVDDAAPAP